MSEPVFTRSAHKWLGAAIFGLITLSSAIYAGVTTPNHVMGTLLGILGGALVGFAASAMILLNLAYWKRRTSRHISN
jgi:ABC-type multidrug transport system permease subunit